MDTEQLEKELVPRIVASMPEYNVKMLSARDPKAPGIIVEKRWITFTTVVAFVRLVANSLVIEEIEGTESELTTLHYVVDSFSETVAAQVDTST